MENTNELKEALALLEQEKNRTAVLRNQIKALKMELANRNAQKDAEDTSAMFELISKNAHAAQEIAKRSQEERRAAHLARIEAEHAMVRALISATLSSIVFALAGAFAVLAKPSGIIMGMILFVVFAGGCMAQKSFSKIVEFFGGKK